MSIGLNSGIFFRWWLKFIDYNVAFSATRCTRLRLQYFRGRQK